MGTPGSARAGRTAANRSSSWRSATFTLRNPVPTGVVIGPFQRHAAIADRVERRLRQERAVGLQGSRAGHGVDPLDVAVRGVQDQPGRGRDLGADAVTRDECDLVCHEQEP